MDAQNSTNNQPEKDGELPTIERPVTSRAQPKKGNMAVMVLGALLALAVIVAGITTYLWREQARTVGRLEESARNSDQKVESLENQLQETTKDTEKTDEVAEDMPAETPVGSDKSVSSSDADETKSIIETTGAYARARVGSENAKLNITIMKKQPSFARVSVMDTEGVGGYACVLKKSDDIWLVLFCGQGVPLQSELDQWAVPASIIQS